MLHADALAVSINPLVRGYYSLHPLFDLGLNSGNGVISILR